MVKGVVLSIVVLVLVANVRIGKTCLSTVTLGLRASPLWCLVLCSSLLVPPRALGRPLYNATTVGELVIIRGTVGS
jgi:hypothetical protein